QIATMDPQIFHVRRLPHVPQLTFPRARVARSAGPVTPTFSHLLSDLRRDEIRQPLIHRPETSGVDYKVCGKLCTITEHDCIFCQVTYLPWGKRDFLVYEQLRGSDIDVVSRTAS